jgi:hypothetical protein
MNPRLFAYRALNKLGRAFIASSDRLAPAPKLSAADKILLARNAVFKNKHSGERGFVVGTGPSIETQDLRPLSNEITFAVSGFWKHSIIELWQPTYYCLSDPLLFDGSPNMREFFNSLTQHVPHSTFFVPLSARQVIEEQKLLPLGQTYYVCFSGEISQKPLQDLDLQQPVPGVMIVSQFCILVAMYMGISPIYLLGLDHDWLSHRGETKHFYRGHAGLERHPEVRPVLGDWSYRFLMECQLTGWKGYENLQDFAVQRNIQIFNATNGGFLDVYERADYNSLVEKP